MKNKNYEMNEEKVNELMNEMYYGEGQCGIDEVVSYVCGKEFYGNWDDEELKYVEEVMREFCYVKVSFDLDYEVMNIDGEVEN